MRERREREREREITASTYSCFFGYSLGPNIVDPILTLVLPISIWKGKNIFINSCMYTVD